MLLLVQRAYDIFGLLYILLWSKCLSPLYPLPMAGCQDDLTFDQDTVFEDNWVIKGIQDFSEHFKVWMRNVFQEIKPNILNPIIQSFISEYTLESHQKIGWQYEGSLFFRPHKGRSPEIYTKRDGVTWNFSFLFPLVFMLNPSYPC